MKPEITLNSFLSCQVCVPEDWSDSQAEGFVNSINPAGTTNGWIIRKQGHELLNGAEERVPCAAKKGHVHIMFDC